MAVYIHTSVSHTACGNSAREPLQFNLSANSIQQVDADESVQFYSMDGFEVDKTEQRIFDSFFAVVTQLIVDSGLTVEQLSKTALMLGSTSLDIGTIVPKTGSKIWIPKIDRLSRRLQDRFGLNQCHLVFNTACTASINALLYSKKLIEMAGYKHVIVVGCEFYNHLTVEGFHSLDLLSPEKLTPFQHDRKGLLLGEGVGAILLSQDRPERIACYKIMDGYSGCDISSLTMTAEDGSHIKKVMQNAISRSGLDPSEIDLVKVHGTATYNNDVSEYNALTSCFNTNPTIFALKQFVGHTLGACGAIEIALMDYMLQQPSMPISEKTVADDDKFLLPLLPFNSNIINYTNILINHCGFGGNNAAVVLRTDIQ